ncbi:2-Hydroxyacid oxidase 1-like isoform X2 [Daktulosphaira vitifoliae]|uniref:2-Hydroxyacid oxidase 1-like isoform X2 n=1 Tax=Daktulosphaira vitifoliae TaxID=58002 RepID=UPI0021AA0822|nr:2-Hydroxyacid oxidase 1-like isoform X2 [Daktulosphaira vitifoliae]
MFGKLVSVKDYENYAANTLSKTVLDFYKSGACDEYTLSLNEQAFSRLRIIPNMLRNVCNRNYNLTILGNQVKIPIGISPCSMHKMAHEDGECASAQAAGKHGAIFILATLSTCSIEEVALAAPETIKWFQLYIYKDKPGNFTEEKYIIPKCDGSGLTNYVTSLFEEKLVWEDVKWLKSITNLPIVVKGILSVADAKIAADIGCHAVFVSNHGGRQLDTAPASIEALPSIVKEVGHRIDVYLDCGIRHGTDVFKALALGAKMVFLARPILWGLTYDGLKGAENILGIIINEFDNTMALTGCRTLDDIKKDMVVHESIYSKL